MSTHTNDIFNREFSRQYDAYNHKLAEITDNLHLLISLLLNTLPSQARVLCVGVGTGSEILRLAQQHPQWHFDGVDPSPDMLAVCHEKLADAGIAARCTLHEGYLSDLPVRGDYDAVLCLLVTHFIQHPQRDGIYTQMARQLKNDGRMITAEIAGDMQSPAFDEQLEMWKTMHEVASLAPRDKAEIKAQLSQRLLLLPPEQTENLIATAGFTLPQRFFQSLLIHGWTARKAP
ncbi:class I SAM-dependent methyltransferase [Kosakonia sp. BK9b]